MKHFSFIFGLIAFSTFFWGQVPEAHAECVVQSATFRAINQNGQPTQISQDYWYQDSPQPYVYIDFVTTGCQPGTDQFELSITEWDNFSGAPAWVVIPGFAAVSDTSGLSLISGGWDDDDVNGTDLVYEWTGNVLTNLLTGFADGFVNWQNASSLWGVYCNPSSANCIDNKPITVPSQANFTRAFVVGEDECDSTSTPNCVYYIRINDEVLGGANEISQVNRLQFNCFGACDKDWVSLDNISPQDLPYQGYVQNDPALASNQDTEEGEPSLGVTQINVDLDNPIGGEDMTIVDLINKVLKFALTIGIPIVAIAIIYSGLLFITARGNDAQLETAKNAFTYAVIGGAILLGCWIFAKIIRDTINSIAVIIHYFG